MVKLKHVEYKSQDVESINHFINYNNGKETKILILNNPESIL